MRAPSLVLALALTAGGCLGETNPCPRGLQPDRDADRCAPADAGVTDAPSPICSAADLDGWSARFLAPGLVELIRSCAGWCGEMTSCLADCLAEAAGLTSCETCVEGTVICTGLRCRAACSSGTDAQCRACQCEAGCVAMFDECTQADLEPALCRHVHGDPSTDFGVAYPIVLRRKSETGYTRATAIAPLEQSHVSYVATGWTDFVAFSVGGVEYLLESMGACGDARCPVRVSPVLASGALGRPVWEAEWTAGEQGLAWFGSDGEAYVLQYRLESGVMDEEPLGAVLVHRFRAAERAPELRVDLVHRDTWITDGGAAWTHLRPFALGGVPHLLRHRRSIGEEEGDVDIVRVVLQDDRLGVARVSRELDGDASWDLVETFPAGDRWFLLRYASEASPSHAAGTAMISALLSETGNAVTIGPPIVIANWPTTITAIHPLRTPAQTLLLRVHEQAGRADLVAVPPDVSAWPSPGFQVVHTERWGTVPPWDVVTVLRARLWETP